ncbi:MAG: peptidase S41, partial [Bacteroidetes bacterium]
ETRRNFVQVEREREIHSVPVGGGTPQRQLNAVGFSPAVSPNGRFVAFERGSCRIAREAYRGPANRSLWLYDRKNQTFTQLTSSDAQEIYPDWGNDQQLYFLSAENGKYNLHRLSIDANGSPQDQAEALTSFTDDGIRSFDVSADGSHIVFERQTALWYMDAASGKVRQLPVAVTADYRFDPIERKTFTSEVEEYAVSPNEEQIAFVVRGEIFVTENNDKSRSVQLTRHPFRDQDPLWLNDSSLLFVSDREGQMDLYLLTAGKGEKGSLFHSLRHQLKRLTQTEANEHQPVLSPDGKQLAYLQDRGRLLVADIAPDGSLSNTRTLADGWATPEDVSWSPDSKWLAYAMDDLDFNLEIYLQAADNSRPPTNVSLHPKGDHSPVWSADGSKLGFLSARNNGDYDVWFVWLKRTDWEKTQRDWEESEEEKKKEENQQAVEVVIDFEDIHERLQQVTALPGSESDLQVSQDGEYFYFVTNRGGRQVYQGDTDLYAIKWDGSDQKALTTGNQSPRSVQLGPKGKELFLIRSGGRMAKVETEKAKMSQLPISAQMEINHPEERRQVFDEAWRTLALGFYDPQFHGIDFAALRAKYEPWAMKASTKTDFIDMFNDMLGQLNASHMGMRGRDRAETQQDRTGLLGLEVKPVAGGVQIVHVVPHAPADRTDSKLEVGELITAVNDQPIGPGVNFYSLFTQKVNERILMSVRTPGGQGREVVIRPTAALNDLLYEEWVKQRKALTEKYSGGRLGYVHIRGMNLNSFERFERELTASGLGKEGLVIDVRFNGGGWTTDYLMTVLNVRQHAYTVPRGAAADLEKEHLRFRQHYPFGERLPLASWTRPSIALCNQNSYSNAEIFSHAYKTLDIGTLVGTPTFGAVISTGGRRLLDGSFVRLPFRAWYVKATDQNMEHGPAVPDIVVENAPDSKAKGEDPQLKRAVEELLNQIDGKTR